MSTVRFAFDRAPRNHRLNPSLVLVTNGRRRVSARASGRGVARVARNGAPAGGIKFGSDVQAIVYRNSKVTHAPYRAHAFGGKDFHLQNGPRGGLTITGMVDRTGLEAWAMPDGSVVLRFADGRPVWDDVPDTE